MTAIAVVGGGAFAGAQPRTIRPDLTPTVESAPIRAGAPVVLRLTVTLPGDAHVQANQPRDPSLIPTVLTLDPPAGGSVGAITYPRAMDRDQAGQREPLVVYGPEFTVVVRLDVAAGTAVDDLVIPARLRYQACDATT